MKDEVLDRLRVLVRGLREAAPSEEAECRALETFERELGRKGCRPEDRGRPGRQVRG